MKRIVLILLAVLLLCGCTKMEIPSSSSESVPEAGSSSASESASASESTPASESTSVSESTSASESTPASESTSASESAPASSSASSSAPASSGDDEWRLRVVSAAHPLPSELKLDLTEVQGYRVDSRMAPYLKDMINAAASDGIHLSIISGYRTFDKSAQLYENEVQAWINLGYSREDALTNAAARVAPAGTSEHHTGLAADIFTAEWKGGFVDAFEDDAGGRWLYENCSRFGFILRFPKDKTDITGIDYEPWHFRYVGVDNAKAIMSQGICLEEYVDTLAAGA